jgi:acyl carrier protein
MAILTQNKMETPSIGVFCNIARNQCRALNRATEAKKASTRNGVAQIDNQQRVRTLVKRLGFDMTREQISEFCIVSLANLLRVPQETVRVDAPFNRLGLDSAMVVYLMMDLEERLGVGLSPDDFYDYPTVNALSRSLTERQATRSAV